MAEHITLAAYLNELATLLREESFNEVISHCRYILQHYPQNVETYRLLGQALLQRGQHGGGLELVNEAAEVFQRVLSVSPVDHVAHLCLSEIRETDGDLDQAIWHLERAYEQMSGNKELQAALRELYIKRGGEESAPEKIQLTRGALARQYASGQLYDQAIIELRAALDQMPGRVDLQVLLAQTLWDSQHPVEAAEVSVQILKKLPYCLPANCILAQLWLDNERPTDAQVFLDRITAVDPYEAMRILQPDVESADTNVLAHLDYSAQAAAALSSETPDWVHELGDLNESAGMDRALGVDTFGDSAPLDMGALFSEQSDSPPDWLAGDMSLPADTGSAAEQDDGLPNWFSDLDSQDTGSAPQGDDWLSPSEDDFGFGDWMSEQGADAPEGSGVAAEESQAEDVDIPEPTFEELFGSADDVPDAPAEVGSVPDWLGAAIEDAGVDVPGFEDVDMPEPAFEDLFGSVDDAPDAPAEAGSVPDWLGAAMEDAGGDVPEFEDADMLEPAFEDLFGPVDEIPDAPAEAGSVPDWLGAVMEEPEEAAPSGFTDLLAAYEAQHPA
ncbi:MAG: hypothetical protein JXQ72_13850, partial [Anaerolineae bacterium]|nr:hypothetical protein [Anaerolineae bacterium]